jgi:hypothetical protein
MYVGATYSGTILEYSTILHYAAASFPPMPARLTRVSYFIHYRTALDHG